MAQVGLSLILLVGAGLLLRSLWALQNVDPGFDSNGVLRATLNLPNTERYEAPETRAAFYDGLVRELEALPGVSSVGAVDALPLSGSGGCPSTCT